VKHENIYIFIDYIHLYKYFFRYLSSVDHDLGSQDKTKRDYDDKKMKTNSLEFTPGF